MLNMLHSVSIKNSFAELHQRSTFTEIGNTNGKTVVICKIFYALTLMKELKFKGQQASTPKIYDTCVDKTNDQLINSHINITLMLKTNACNQSKAV